MKTGIFFCQLSENWPTDIDAVAKYSANLPNVQTVKDFGIRPKIYVEDLIQLIKTNNLERVVIAGERPFAEFFYGVVPYFDNDYIFADILRRPQPVPEIQRAVFELIECPGIGKEKKKGGQKSP